MHAVVLSKTYKIGSCLTLRINSDIGMTLKFYISDVSYISTVISLL